MSFIISARASSGEVRYRRNSMLGALEQGLSLSSVGMDDVIVTDLRGRRYTPAEFSRLLTTASATDASGAKPVETTLAA